MNQELNLFGTIKDGKIELQNKEALSQWTKNQQEGDAIVFKIRNQKDYYSVRQLRLIYKQFREISKSTGHSIEDVKTILKIFTGNCYVHTIEGREITQCKSISDFNRRELSEFIEQIDLWCAKTLGFSLLSSEDLKFLKS